MIPYTYEEWKNCIVNDCKIELTKDFAKRRLAVYEDASSKETIKFKQLHGADHLSNVIYWLRQV